MNKQNTETIKDAIIEILDDNKALDIQALDITKLTDIADYMIIATANSTVHVKSLIDKVSEKIKSLGMKPIGIEGEDTREWMLIDFGDVIAHVILKDVRQFYNLEKLWGLDKISPDRKGKGVKSQHTTSMDET